MSQENLEIVRQIYDAVARRDAETVLALYDPEVEIDASRSPYRSMVGRDVYRGHEELRRFFREYYEPWEYIEDECEELIDAGDQVISIINSRARGRASGAEVEATHQAGIWTIREGKVVRVAWFPTRAEALEAAGVAE